MYLDDDDICTKGWITDRDGYYFIYIKARIGSLGEEKFILKASGEEKNGRFRIPLEIWKDFKMMVAEAGIIEIDMNEIVGVGGEGIVLREKRRIRGEEIQCAVKYSFYKFKWAKKHHREIYYNREGEIQGPFGDGADFYDHLSHKVGYVHAGRCQSEEFGFGVRLAPHRNILQILDYAIAELFDSYYFVSGT